MRAQGVSLWLVPDGPEALAASALIAELACRFGTPAFAPHVTLLAGLTVPPEVVVAGARVVAASLSDCPVRFLGLAHAPDYFHALYARAAEELPILEARQRAETVLAAGTYEVFTPHLSLLYGALPHETLRLLADEVQAAAPSRMVMRALEVVSTEGAVHEWRSLARMRLA